MGYKEKLKFLNGSNNINIISWGGGHIVNDQVRTLNMENTTYQIEQTIRRVKDRKSVELKYNNTVSRNKKKGTNILEYVSNKVQNSLNWNGPTNRFYSDGIGKYII